MKKQLSGLLFMILLVFGCSETKNASNPVMPAPPSDVSANTEATSMQKDTVYVFYGPVDIRNNLNVIGILNVGDVARIQGRIYAMGGVDISNTLNVVGAASFSSPVSFSSNVFCNGWFHSNEDITTSKNLSAQGNVRAKEFIIPDSTGSDVNLSEVIKKQNAIIQNLLVRIETLEKK